MRNISAWAIRHPVFPLILFVVLTVCGVVAFIRLPINLNPDVSAPFIQVFIAQPGAVPSELETQVMQKVDAAIANIGDDPQSRSGAGGPFSRSARACAVKMPSMLVRRRGTPSP